MEIRSREEVRTDIIHAHSKGIQVPSSMSELSSHDMNIIESPLARPHLPDVIPQLDGPASVYTKRRQPVPVVRRKTTLPEEGYPDDSDSDSHDNRLCENRRYPGRRRHYQDRGGRPLDREVNWDRGYPRRGRPPNDGGPPDDRGPPDDGGPPDGGPLDGGGPPDDGGPPGNGRPLRRPRRQGPPGPPGPVHPIIVQQPQVTFDTTVLENTFGTVGQSMLQLARAQDQTNRYLQEHLQQGQMNMQAHTGALQQLATSTYQRNFDHIFASIPIYDGSDRKGFFPWLEHLEAACFYSGRKIKTEALGRLAGPVQNVIMALPNACSWKAIREELKRCFSDQTSLEHAATQLENMTQKPNEPLRLYIFRYSKIHKSVTKRDACYDTDPSRWFRFLTSITNTTIADKITRSENLPQNLQQCFEKALRLEASLQLSEGVNMARRTTVMDVDVDTEDEVNLIKDVRARSNACYKCGEMGHFQRDCKYDGDKPSDNWQEQDGNYDLYDPVVGKWMTNLVATTPITAKAMKSLYAELNRQKDLKRTYRRRYKDLQAVVATTTNTPATISCSTMVTSSKTTPNVQMTKTSLAGQQKRTPDKGKAKPIGKAKKNPIKTSITTSGPSANLCSQLKDKAKHTAALIQEITEELQAIEEESAKEEQDSDATQMSDLEQEDNDIPLTEDEQ